MTQRQIDRAVAAATGESLDVVRRMGFSIVEDSEDELPSVVDWDAIDAQRTAMLPDRQGLLEKERRAA